MTTRNEKLQAIWHHYESARGHQPTGTREACDWAVAEGLIRLPEIDPLDILAGQMADERAATVEVPMAARASFCV